MVKQKGERVWTAPIVATVEHLGELLEDSGLDFVVGYKDAKNPAAEAQIAKETAQRQPSPSSATIPAAGGDTTAAQIKKYESFVNDRLRVDLQNTLDARDKVYETISEYLKLRNQIELLQTQNLTSLKTMMDVGCEFFMQATIPRLDQITVKIGLDVHVVLTLPEGLMFIARKEQALVKVADRYTSRAADLKAQIKMVLGAIEALLEVG
ncbi:uncharacterized protein EV422DRAFT_583745 [Fimicolochytrium jonesii]|uniref:uncharacterized protein n=1 Tax=Fimicolochytrium jonesii TaxID=1396493 RepID=UPI0022FEF310|nr:uncharacterized protein EV422DRAFT_583745 [Fimicolochytrium jonesii]KAI8824843.1 hypothetical protein EV422DRAFT_583745 [Fimicolochytrium jonesii]